jgi:hypothetical protein
MHHLLVPAHASAQPAVRIELDSWQFSNRLCCTSSDEDRSTQSRYGCNAAGSSLMRLMRIAGPAYGCNAKATFICRKMFVHFDELEIRWRHFNASQVGSPPSVKAGAQRPARPS